jgi:hypothetical protein
LYIDFKNYAGEPESFSGLPGVSGVLPRIPSPPDKKLRCIWQLLFIEPINLYLID